MTHIFISYSPRDSKVMLTLRELLLRAGFRPWIDPAPRPGLDWRGEIDDAIRAADLVLLVITPNSASSVYVTYEWSLALGLGIPVIPIIYKPAQFHPRLTTLPGFDMSAWKEERQFWEHVIRELQRLVKPSSAPPTSASAPLIGSALPPASLPGDYNRSIMPTQPGHWIVVRRGPNLNAMHHLEKNVVTLGRDAANDIAISDPEVSRYHLRFIKQGSVYVVEDLGSTNGTMIDGRRINGLHPLRGGTAISLGDTIMISYEVV